MSAPRFLLLAPVFLLLRVLSPAATLSLDASTLYGLPGQTVGFGFAITSTPDAIYDRGNIPYLVITSADLQTDLGSYPVGVFTPFLATSFTVIGPDAGGGEVNPFSQHFDDSLMTGIGSYAINAFQAIGDMAQGNIVLTYDEYSVSPNDPGFDPTLDTLLNGQLLTAPVTVIVGTAPASVPEPAAPLLIGIGLAAGIPGRRRIAKVLRSTQR